MRRPLDLRRRTTGALWALPPLLAFLPAARQVDVAFLTFFGLFFALLALVPPFPWRSGLRVGFVALTLFFRWGTGKGLLLVLATATYHKLTTGDWGGLTAAQASLLFEVMVPLAVLATEQGAGLGVRLLEALIGITALAVAEEAGAGVGFFAVWFIAFFFPVRYADEEPAKQGGGDSALTFGFLMIGLSVLAFLVSPSWRKPLAFTPKHAVTGVNLNVTNLDVPVSQSRQPQFFALTTFASNWIVFTSDTYTGQGWQHPSYRAREKASYQVANPYANALSLVGTAQITTYEPLAEDPSPGTFLGVIVPRSSWLKDPAGNGYQVSAKSFAVTYVLPISMKPKALQAASGPIPSSFQADLALPATLPSAVTLLAQQIVAGVPSDTYDRVQAITNYLKTHDTYTLNVPLDDGRDFVYDFLFIHKSGDCNAFSSAFAILARSVGIPVRWVVGYAQGTRERGGYLVRADDAHSWDEVYYPSIGWLPIDPTPGFIIAEPTNNTASAQSGEGLLGRVKFFPTGFNFRRQNGENLGGPVSTAPQSTLPPLWPLLGGLALVIVIFLVRFLGTTGRSIRLAAHLSGRAWASDRTVREWLGGEAPRFQAYAEWHTYRVPGPNPVSATAARQDLRAFLLKGRSIFRFVGALLFL